MTKSRKRKHSLTFSSPFPHIESSAESCKQRPNGNTAGQKIHPYEARHSHPLPPRRLTISRGRPTPQAPPIVREASRLEKAHGFLSKASRSRLVTPVVVDIGVVPRTAIARDVGTDVGILAALEPGFESAVVPGHRAPIPHRIGPAPETNAQALRYKNATM